jgi:hypothetical protein
MGYLDLDNLDHDGELATALGNMVVAWARAETTMVQAYSAVSKMHYNLASAAYYNIPTFESRTKVILATIDEMPDPFPERESLRDAILALAKLAKTRNGWVHGLWVSDQKTSVTHVFNMKKGGTDRRAIQVTANAVQQHIKAVRQRAAELDRYAPVRIALRT